MACPCREAALKPLLAAGKMMKATTVTSLPELFSKWFSLARVRTL